MHAWIKVQYYIFFAILQAPVEEPVNCPSTARHLWLSMVISKAVLPNDYSIEIPWRYSHSPWHDTNNFTCFTSSASSISPTSNPVSSIQPGWYDLPPSYPISSEGEAGKKTKDLGSGNMTDWLTASIHGWLAKLRGWSSALEPIIHFISMTLPWHVYSFLTHPFRTLSLPMPAE